MWLYCTATTSTTSTTSTTTTTTTTTTTSTTTTTPTTPTTPTTTTMGFRSYVRHFRGAILGLLRPSEAWCFAPGGDCFEAVLLLAAAGNRISRKMLFF